MTEFFLGISQDFWTIVAGFISACGVELIVAIMSFYVEKEKIERNIKTAIIVVGILWGTTGILIPIWIFAGPSYLVWIFPVNHVLPFIVPPAASPVIATARVFTILRERMKRH